jgi:uncharacterized protein (TIGR00661 family)
MRILYGIQGTGNGHITRAIEIIPQLHQQGIVDVLVSGYQSEIPLPFPVKYKMNGMSFIFGKQGGVDIWKTYQQLNSLKFLKEINQLDVKKYDMIISDFEPITSWAAIKAKKPTIGLSNQVATLHPLAPKPKHIDVIGKLVLQNYAPTTYNYGLHFKALDNNVFTPIIRSQIRNANVTTDNHYTVYLPAYDDDKILKHLLKFKQVPWQVFSKHSKKKYRVKHITVRPIETESFLKSVTSCKGVICNAGFGTTSEALFLQKKLMVVPMKTQYEQHCNAAMLKTMGVPILKKLNADYYDKIEDFLENQSIVDANYPDNAQQIVHRIFDNHAGNTINEIQFESTHYSLFQ